MPTQRSVGAQPTMEPSAPNQWYPSAASSAWSPGTWPCQRIRPPPAAIRTPGSSGTPSSQASPTTAGASPAAVDVAVVGAGCTVVPAGGGGTMTVLADVVPVVRAVGGTGPPVHAARNAATTIRADPARPVATLHPRILPAPIPTVQTHPAGPSSVTLRRRNS